MMTAYILQGIRASLVVLIAYFSVTDSEAQTRPVVKESPDELVAAFVRGYGEPGKSPSAARLNLTAVLLDRADYAPADVEAVLNGLEHVALTGQSSGLRAKAALSLSAPGSQRALKPRQGSAARLERLYRRSNDREVRAAIVAGLAGSVEHEEAVAFLETIATNEKADYPGSAVDALTAIAAHGEQGSMALKRLHEIGAVKEPNAKNWLELAAQRGYKIR